MTNTRTRMAAMAGSLALSLALVSGPVALAQDDGPEATFEDFADSFASLDLVALSTFFCAEHAEALGGIGLADLTGEIPAGFEFMLDAISIDFEFESLDVVSQTDTEAIVDVLATMSAEFDVEALMPLVIGMMESFGLPEEEIEEARTEMLADLPEPETMGIEGQVTLVPGETRPWVICSDLSGLIASDDMSEEDSTEEDSTEEDSTGADSTDE